MNSLSEKEIIGIFAKSFGIKDLDDVARIGRSTVLKCDMLVSSTDVPPRMKPWQIARKSLVSCASDLAAKGARPTAAMVSIGLPSGFEPKFVRGLADGFARASEEFNVKIVGGDTNEAEELVIDCCMVGEIGASRMPTRAGARPGHVVVVSGLFGLPAAGLAIMMKGAQSTEAFARRAIQSVLEPSPRQLFGTSLARYFSSSIDSSDGLAISLYELARSSRVDFTIDSIPVASGIESFAAENGMETDELVFHGGEEYEIVATIPKSRIALAQAAARKAGVRLHLIGSVKPGSGKVRVGGKGLENRGYTHFSPR
jgi:thiamine-monophosphate kinase